MSSTSPLISGRGTDGWEVDVSGGRPTFFL